MISNKASRCSVLKILVIPLLVLFMAGCTVKFPQVERIVHALKNEPPAVDDYKWQLITMEYSAEVLAVSTENGTVFANQFDDALLFDGNAVRRVVKISSDDNRYEIVDIEQGDKLLRQFMIEGDVVAQYVCEPWVKLPETWTQHCSSLGTDSQHINRLQFNADGELTFIQQVYRPDGASLTLKKLL